MEATLTATTDPIYDGIRRLAALDTDRATLENGLGFSGTDTKYGHILAATPREGWTREMVYVAYNIARRYANTQLSDLNWDAIPEPEHKNEWTGKRSFTPGRVLAWEPTGTKYTGQPVFVLTFPKQFELIAKVRSLPKRAWGADRDDRGWEAPVTRANAEAIKRLVEDWTFTVLPQAQTALDEALAGPQMETTVNPLRIERGEGTEYKGQVALIFSPYGHASGEAIRKLPVRRWGRTRENKAWEVPYRADALLPVFDLAQEYGFEVTFDLAGLVEGELASRAANLVASRASDTDFVITGSAREPYPFQRAGIEYAVNNLKPGQGVLIADAMGLGKALANGTRVLTPWGWTPIQDLEIGSWVIGVDGKPHRVIGVYPQGDRDLFRVSFSDGTSVVADKDHLWAVRTADGRYQDDFEEVLTTEKIAERGTRTSAGNAVHFIPMVAPVEFEPESPLPLHPYVLGALLGDGGLTTATPCLTTVDSELLERVTSLLPEGVAAVRTEEDGLSYRLVGDGARFEKNPLTTALRSLGLMGKHSWEKAVPHRYLFGTVEERVETLRGLMDTDGHAGVIAEFTTTSEQLGHDVMFLVQSLGGVARWASKTTSYRNRAGEKVEGRRAYRLTITLDINPFSLSRKANAWKPNEKYPARRSITSVESVGTGSATCIAVDAVDQLFVTEHCIVTHNTIQGILTAHMVEGTPVLVVAPASLKLVWEREIKATLPQASVAIVNGTKGDLPIADWTIINYDLLAKRLDQLLARGFKTVIGDEGHYLKNKKAQRTRAFTEIVKSATYTLLLSGTFTLNRPIELTSPLDVIGRLGSFGGFFQFAKRYCNPPETPIWMGDYTFRPLGDVRVGDEVIGWERAESQAKKISKGLFTQKTLVRATVSHVMRRVSPIVKVTLESGRVLRCTPDHRWLNQNQGGPGWYYATPVAGRKLVHVVEPVYPSQSRDAAWLAGIYDGEGTGPFIAQHREHNPEVHQRIQRALDVEGIPYTARDTGIGITGGRQGIVDFLNRIDPVRRLTRQNDRRVLSRRFGSADKIVSVEPDGEGEVISLTTTTGNYVAWGYASKNCGAYKGPYGWVMDGAVDELLPELNDLMRSQCYVRRTKEQVLTELPPKVRADRPVEITNRKEYREAEEDIVAYSYKAALESKAFYKSLAGLSREQSQQMRQDHANNAAMKASRAKVLTQIAKTKRLAGQGKMAALTELVESLRAENEPFIIFAWHTDLVEEIGRAFAIPVIHGGVSQQARDRAVTSLTTGKVDGIGGNIGAMGVGLTMVKCGSRPITNVIFVEYGWNPGTMDQAEDRAHRIGQAGDSVTIHRLYGSQTIDEDSIALIEHKRRVVDAVTEGLPVTEEEEADIEFLIERIKRRLSNLPSEDSEDEIKRWIGKR